MVNARKPEGERRSAFNQKAPPKGGKRSSAPLKAHPENPHTVKDTSPYRGDKARKSQSHKVYPSW